MFKTAEVIKQENKTLVIPALLLMTAFIGCSLAALIILEVNKAVFISACTLILCFVTEYYIYNLCTNGEIVDKTIVISFFSRVLLKCVVGSLILEALTLIGNPIVSPLDFSSWSGIRLLCFGCLIYCIQVIPLIFQKDIQPCSSSYEGAQSDNHVNLVYIFILIACFVLACAFATGLLNGSSPVLWQRITFAVFLGIFGCIVLFYLYKKKNINQVGLYIICALTIGSILSFTTPPVVGVSWDDQIHFDRAVGVSYIEKSVVSEADYELLSMPWINNSIMDYSQIPEAVTRINSTYEKSITNNETWTGLPFTEPFYSNSLAAITTFGALPSAFGLWFARLLRLPFTCQLMVGRWFNLLFYVSITGAAIKVAPFKKKVFTVIALLPTNLFLASNYSYDPWVISFLMLGAALLFRDLSLSTLGFSWHRTALISFVFFLGLCPKAIYFPILFLLLFLMKKNETLKRDKRIYRTLVLCFVLYVICTFVLPLLLSPATQAGDSRGGSDVNAVGQIVYVVTHPISYLKLIVPFLLTYLSPFGSDGYTLSFGYMGHLNTVLNWTATVPFVILLLASIDGWAKPSTKEDKILRWSSLGLVLLCTVLVVTTLYVVYNPVGSNSIVGVQSRYLTPLLVFMFPMLGPCGSGVRDRTNGAMQIYVPPTIAICVFSILGLCVCVLPWATTL